MYLMSAVADNADQQAVEERLLETADEITDVLQGIFRSQRPDSSAIF